MSTNRTLSVLALAALSILGIYRDAGGQLCNGINQACVQNTQVPCSQGMGA